MHLNYKVASLDFNTLGVEYFRSIGFIFWTTCLDAYGEKIEVSWKIFSSLVDKAKSCCLGGFI